MNISHFTALFSHTPDLIVFHCLTGAKEINPTGYHEFSERESHFRDLNKCTDLHKKLHQISENNKTFFIKNIIKCNTSKYYINDIKFFFLH